MLVHQLRGIVKAHWKIQKVLIEINKLSSVGFLFWYFLEGGIERFYIV